jgi:hypothetical protein
MVPVLILCVVLWCMPLIAELILIWRYAHGGNKEKP